VHFSENFRAFSVDSLAIDVYFKNLQIWRYPNGSNPFPLELAIPTTSSYVQPELTSVKRWVSTHLSHTSYFCTKRTLLPVVRHNDLLIHQLTVSSTTLIPKQRRHEPKNRFCVDT
jgi:hypothetical protein